MLSGYLSLNSGEVIDVNEHESILDAALRNDLFIEYSCRNGQCGACKTQVTSGNTFVIHEELSLTEEELLSGLVLSCCRGVAGDVGINAENLTELKGIKKITGPCKIDSLVRYAVDVVEVVLRTPPSSVIEFLPGQYIDIIGPNGVRRSYSIANAPMENGRLRLFVKKVEGGVFSEYWFNSAKVNDLLRFEGPLGTFYLPKNNKKHLVLLATGTGIAPIQAILEGLVLNPDKNTFDSVTLFWGGRYESDIFKTMDFDLENYKFIPVLSRKDGVEGAYYGYVQDAVLAQNIDLTDSLVLACGAIEMIKSSAKTLIANGLSKSAYKSDAFVSSLY